MKALEISPFVSITLYFSLCCHAITSLTSDAHETATLGSATPRLGSPCVSHCSPRGGTVVAVRVSILDLLTPHLNLTLTLTIRELDQGASQGDRGWTLPKIAVIFLLLHGYVLLWVKSRGRFVTHIWPVSPWLTLKNTILLKVYFTSGPESKQCLPSTAPPLEGPGLCHISRWDTLSSGWQHAHPLSSRQMVMWTTH